MSRHEEPDDSNINEAYVITPGTCEIRVPTDESMLLLIRRPHRKLREYL
jgi:hypothetical protein